MKTIEIIISPAGKTRLQTHGFTGTDCQQASRFLEQALGQQLTETLTPAFHETQNSEQTHQQTDNSSTE